jgi:hypothetical protein
MKNNLIKTIIITIVVGLLGFYGGIQYQKSQRVSFSANSAQRFAGGTNQQSGAARQGRAAGFNPVSGQITSLDKSTITIKTQDGSSKIVVYSSSTKVNKTSEGSMSDLKVGDQIMTIGSTASDGTVTAQSISVGGKIFQGGMPNGSQPGQDGKSPSGEQQ